MITLRSHDTFNDFIKYGMLIILSSHALMFLIIVTRFIRSGPLFHRNLYTNFSNCFMNFPDRFGKEIKRYSI